MARKRRFEYTATVKCSLGWTSNSDTWTYSASGDFDGIETWAQERIAEMRSTGAASAIRTVTMRHWDDWDRGADDYRCPPILEASYFDDEQGLAEVEVYAARVHDWHAMTDRHNRDARLGPFEYRPWQVEWGTEPTVCAACEAVLTPQNFFKYNGKLLVWRDGTTRRMGT